MGTTQMQNVDELLKRLDNQYGLEYHSETEDGFALYQDSKVRKDRICQDAILTIRAQQTEIERLSKPKDISNNLFSGDYARNDIEDYISENLEGEFDLSWDNYDWSLEIKGVSKEFVLLEHHQKWFHDAGFLKIYVSKDGTAEVYSFYDYEIKAKTFPAKVFACSPYKPKEEILKRFRSLKAEIERLNGEYVGLRQTLKMLWMQYILFVDVENDEIASKCKNYVEAALIKETP